MFLKLHVVQCYELIMEDCSSMMFQCTRREDGPMHEKARWSNAWEGRVLQ